VASKALLKVRFPDGTLRYGCYGATSDVPYEALSGDVDEWSVLPLRWDTPAPSGAPVEVAIACNYGGGFWWPGTAHSDRLVETGLSFNGFEEVRTPTTSGLPDWWNQDGHAMEDIVPTTSLPCCFGEKGVHRPSCRFAPSP